MTDDFIKQMNKSFAILFLILLQHSTHSDTIADQIKSSLSQIKEPYSDLSDLTLSNEEALNRVAQKLNTLLHSEITFGANTPQHEKLNQMLDIKYILKNLSGDVRNFDQAKLATALNDLRVLPDNDFANFRTKYSDVESAKSPYINHLIGNFLQVINLKLKNMVCQLLDWFERDQQAIESGSAGLKEFKIIENKEEINEFFQMFSKKPRQNNELQKQLSSNELSEFVAILKEKHQSVYGVGKNNIERFSGRIKNLESLLMALVKLPIAKASEAIRDSENSDMLNGLISTAVDRVGMASLVIRNYDQLEMEAGLLENAMTFCFVNTLNYKSTNPVLATGTLYRNFLLNVQQKVFSAAFQVVKNKTLMNYIRDVFESDSVADIENGSFQDLVTVIFKKEGFHPVVSVNPEEDINKKLKAIDIILFVSGSKFDDKMIEGLLHNFVALKSVSSERVKLLSQSKILFFNYNDPKCSDPNPVISRKNSEFYFNFYNILVSLCTDVNNEDAANVYVHELLDKYIDSVYQNADENDWIKSHYLLVKLYNLFFVSKDAEFHTSFPEFEFTSKIGSTLFLEISKKQTFGETCNNSYKTVTGDTLVSSSYTDKVVMYLSGLTEEARKFRRYHFKFEHIQNDKYYDTKRNSADFKIVFGNDRLKKEQQEQELKLAKAKSEIKPTIDDGVGQPDKNQQDVPQIHVDGIPKQTEIIHDKNAIHDGQNDDQKSIEIIKPSHVLEPTFDVIQNDKQNDSIEEINQSVKSGKIRSRKNDENGDDEFSNREGEYSDEDEKEDSEHKININVSDFDEPKNDKLSNLDQVTPIEDNLHHLEVPKIAVIEDYNAKYPIHDKETPKVDEEEVDIKPMFWDIEDTQSQQPAIQEQDNKIFQSDEIEDNEDELENQNINEDIKGSTYDPTPGVWKAVDENEKPTLETQGLNIVNEVIGNAGEEKLNALRHMSVAEFIDSQPLYEETDEFEISYTYIVVTRSTSPCYPENRC